MKKEIITTINGVAILCLTDTPNQLVPIAPICQALKLNYIEEISKIREDSLTESLVEFVPISYTDEQGAACLPLAYAFGWVFIAGDGPNGERRKVQNRLTCYKDFYNYILNNPLKNNIK